METMHAAGRRRLPPVPRLVVEHAGVGASVVGRSLPAAAAQDGAATERWVLDWDATDVELPRVTGGPTIPAPARSGRTQQDAAQQFVARLRAAAADFAEAAGATTAVVREAVPPARHRRARCGLVLRYADATEVDVTLLGPAGTPGSPSRHGFDRQVRRWLGAGLPLDGGWIVPDPDAPDGVAVDVSAWLATA